VSEKVVAVKGKPSYEITHGERGTTTTVIATFNAVGKYAPVMIIFKGKKMKPEMCVGAPIGSLIQMSENG